MKTLSSLVTIIAVCITLTSCTSSNPYSTQVATNFIKQQNVITPSNQKLPRKNPKKVTFYNNGKTPMTAYKVIGVASISKYNLLGVRRKDTTLNQMMQDLAASMGGDGLINISRHESKVEAKVIAFQKILI